jgi:glycerol-3-phosphate dehydrogenase (NAD(P)+)
VPTVVVLGAGVMGSAFTLPLADAGCTVRLVGTHLDRAAIDGLRRDGVHPRLNAPLPASVRAFHDDELAPALAGGVDLVVLGVSSAGVDWAIERLRPHAAAGWPILMLTKGLAADGRRITILPDVVEAALGVPTGAVGGPCIAGELAVRRQTGTVVSFRDPALLDRVLALLDVPYYQARPSLDLVGTEICAAFKNFFALGIGAAQGMLDTAGPAANEARMHNPAAVLFDQALLELGRLNTALGGTPSSVHGLAGTGDLYVTVQGGRNSRMGRLLGAGWRYARAKAERMAEDTVEGAELALSLGPTLEAMLADGRLDPDDLPLTRAILRAIRADAPFVAEWAAFHRRHGKDSRS